MLFLHLSLILISLGYYVGHTIYIIKSQNNINIVYTWKTYFEFINTQSYYVIINIDKYIKYVYIGGK